MSSPTLSLSQSGAFLANPNVVLIFWGDTAAPASGQFWSDHPDYVNAGVTFFAEFLRGYNVDRLEQYGVGIANICWFGPLVASYPSGGLAEIAANAVAAGTLPQPDQFEDMMYVFVIDPTSSHSGFPNGKHGSFSWNGMNFPFAFAPFSSTLGTPAISGSPTQDGPTWWSQQWIYTTMISHEVYEVMTDPAPYSGWSAANWPPGSTSECCDICEDLLTSAFADPIQYGSWSIEPYWSNGDNVCVLGYANNWVNLRNPGSAISGAVAIGRNATPGGPQLFAADVVGNLWTWVGASSNGLLSSAGTWSMLLPGAGIVAGPPVAAFNPTTQLQEVFAIAQPSASKQAQLWHIYQNSPDGSWSPPQSLGGPLNCEIVGNVSIATNAPNPNNENYPALEAFLIGSDGQLHHIWQLGAWKGWSGWGDSLGAPPPGIATIAGPFPGVGLGPGPCVTNNADGRLEAFVLGQDGNIWHRWQGKPNSGWSAWVQPVSPAATDPGLTLQNIPGSLACSQEINGCLAVFVLTGDGSIFYMDQAAPSNGWRPFAELMPMNTWPALNFVNAPTACGYDQPPQTQIFAIGSDNSLWTIQQGDNTFPAAIPGIYRPWRFVGSPPSHPAGLPSQIPAALGMFDGISVCVIANDGNVWSLSQTAVRATWGELVTET